MKCVFQIKKKVFPMENGFEWQLASSPSLLKKNDGWNVSSDSASIPYTTLTNWEGATSGKTGAVKSNPTQSNPIQWVNKQGSWILLFWKTTWCPFLFA